MTDEQIIKALEYCCGNITFDSDCSTHGCYQVSLPEDRNGDIRWCRQWLMKDALDLVNRQKADIKRMKKIISYLKESIDCSRKEYNRLLSKLQQAKSEAIKEFAERLKKYLCLDLREGISVVTIDNIDKIVKEMTEADK